MLGHAEDGKHQKIRKLVLRGTETHTPHLDVSQLRSLWLQSVSQATAEERWRPETEERGVLQQKESGRKAMRTSLSSSSLTF